MSSLISVTNLTKEYVNEDVVTPVLRGLTFEIQEGNFIAIIGPSGSGKSTLMHVLGFLDTQSGGMYLFEGKDVSTLTNAELAQWRGEKIGFVFQAFHLLPNTSVYDNVQMPLLYSSLSRRERDTRTREVVEIVGLLHRLQHLSHQLSGGEQQRVAIARALVRNPKVIFADEPTGNLDSASGKQVMDTLLSLNVTHGHTILLVTHETYTAEYAQRILTLRDGNLVDDRPVSHRRTLEDGRLLK